MGYRSSVFLSIVIAGEENYNTLLQKILNMSETYPGVVNFIGEMSHTQKMDEYYALNVVSYDLKWYEEDDSFLQDLHEYMMESGLKFRFEFLRVGEDLGDVEELYDENMEGHGDCPFPLSSRVFRPYTDVEVEPVVDFGF